MTMELSIAPSKPIHATEPQYAVGHAYFISIPLPSLKTRTLSGYGQDEFVRQFLKAITQKIPALPRYGTDSGKETNPSILRSSPCQSVQCTKS